MMSVQHAAGASMAFRGQREGVHRPRVRAPPLRAQGPRTAPTCQNLTLLIGNKNYSSWSLRPWLFLKANGIPFEEKQILLYQPDTRATALAAGSPTGKVPALLHDGAIVAWDSLAVLEYLAERFPEAQGWPSGRKERARARSVSAEMHSGFVRVRTEFPMSVKRSRPRATWPAHVEPEIQRIQEIWATERRRAGAEAGPFLFGRFGVADCMFAPVVLRFHSYKIPVEDRVVREYMDAVLALPAMKEWAEAALKETAVIASSDNVD